MKKTMYRWFSAWNFDQEERWLNEMATRGLALTDVGLCRYTFEEGTPGEYAVRLELLENLPGHPESEQYIRFIEGTGAEYIGGLFRWVYFRKKKSLGAFDLYSDYVCRIRHLNRVITMVGFLEVFWALYTAVYLPMSLESDAYGFEIFIFVMTTTLFLVLTYGMIRLLLKKRKLRRDHMLYE